MISKIESYLRQVFTRYLSPFAVYNPNLITLLSLFFSIFAAYCIIHSLYLLATIFLAICFFLDVFDGLCARNLQKSTPLGGILDSVMDRISESIIFFAILINTKAIFLVFFVLVGSFLVPYIRAKAEIFKLTCNVGFGRFGRASILVLSTFFSWLYTNIALIYGLYLIILITYPTILYRLLYIFHQLRSKHETNKN